MTAPATGCAIRAGVNARPSGGATTARSSSACATARHTAPASTARVGASPGTAGSTARCGPAPETARATAGAATARACAILSLAGSTAPNTRRPSRSCRCSVRSIASTRASPRAPMPMAAAEACHRRAALLDAMRTARSSAYPHAPTRRRRRPSSSPRAARGRRRRPSRRRRSWWSRSPMSLMPGCSENLMIVCRACVVVVAREGARCCGT